MTETKAERAERLKRELNPWQAAEAIARFAWEGRAAVPADWLGTYLRWWGVYTQGDGVGAVGGTRGEGRASQYFMVRIRVPNGVLRSEQARVLAGLAERRARGILDITVRQNFQLHWVTIEDLPAIFETLGGIGLTTMGACGDVSRNITGCPLAGAAADEIVDASPLVHAASRLLNGNAEFANLPRKFKISITGCPVWCSYPEINDVGFTALRDPGTGELGFSLRVGGGLSTAPHFGVRLNAFVRWAQVLPVLQAVAEVFRESGVLRENREKARLKFLFLTHGWTAERFQRALEERLGYALEPAVPEEAPDDIYRDHVGVHRQRQDGYVYAGLAVPRGRLTAAQLRAAAEAADDHASGALRTTAMQNLLVLDVRESHVAALGCQLTAAGLHLDGSPFRRGTIACTGTEFCKLALTETKGFAQWLVEDLERRLPGFQQHLKIHVTGCPNSCGQHWIADLGLEGKKLKTDGALVDAYYFCVGGAVGRQQSRARPIGYRVVASEVPAAIERLLTHFLAARRPGENFRQFSARHTDDELRSLLAGRELAAVSREAPAGRVPHGVED